MTSERERKWLIAFDVDGTLLKEPTSSWRLIHKLLNTTERAKQYAKMFYEGKIEYHKWAQLEASLWRGVDYERLREEVLSRIRLQDGCKELFERLRKYPVYCVLVSAGLRMIVEKVAQELGVDEFYANELIIDNKGRITGDVIVNVTFYGKGDVVKKVAEREGIPRDRIIAIGDSESDISMFKVAGISIAVNPPKETILRYVDVVIYGSSLRLLTLVLEKILSSEGRILFKSESKCISCCHERPVRVSMSDRVWSP